MTLYLCLSIVDPALRIETTISSGISMSAVVKIRFISWVSAVPLSFIMILIDFVQTSFFPILEPFLRPYNAFNLIFSFNEKTHTLLFLMKNKRINNLFVLLDLLTKLLKELHYQFIAYCDLECTNAKYNESNNAVSQRFLWK